MKIEKCVCLICICLMSCSSPRKMDCKSYPSEGYIPKDLFDAVEYLNCIWSKKEKELFNKKFSEYLSERLNEDCTEYEDEIFLDEDVFLVYDIGKAIRNAWGLWSGENDLVKFFNSYGIFHPDEMSSIILTSVHRKLNKKDIDFEGQVKSCLNYWKLYQEFEEKETKRVLEAYDKYGLNDLITIHLEIFSDTDGKYASVTVGPDYEWTFNPEKDLELKGKIVQKEIVQDDTGTNVRFLIQIVDVNKEEIVIIWLGRSVKIGEIAEIDMKYLKYE